MNWFYSTENIDWNELSNLYLIAPLGIKKSTDLELAFSNSKFKSFVYDSEKLIGVGRVLADGIDCAYICDIAVHPDYQGTGLGKEIVNSLIDQSKGHKKIILYAAPGKESFYKKFGFKRMLTAMAIFENQEEATDRGLINNN